MKQVQLSILVSSKLIGGGQGMVKVNLAAKSHLVNLGFSKPQTYSICHLEDPLTYSGWLLSQ